jgi:hypothetical protein
MPYLGLVQLVLLMLELAPQVGEHGVAHRVLLTRIRILELKYKKRNFLAISIISVFI